MTEAATYESKTEAVTEAVENQDSAAYVKLWLDALKLAEEEEKQWIKKAEEAVEIFRGDSSPKGRKSYNIVHSNIETMCPALYNSTPIPDIRRRFVDDDPVGLEVSRIIERAISFSIDVYDFDAVMKGIVRDGELCGRGVPRIRYVPHFGDDGMVAYEEVTCEYVPWRYFQRGPGRTWNDVSWISFTDFLTRESLRELCGDAKDKNGKLVADVVPLNYTAGTKQSKPGETEASIFRRAIVKQIWDKESRKVISICPDYADAPLAVVEDPLELEQFFPVPRPYQPIATTDSLVPIVPYAIYEDHVAEINAATTRIYKLVEQMRLRGGYASDQSNDLKLISEADDGELVPMTGVSHLATEGGLDKAITWWPIENIPPALKVLFEHRESIKQTIYEITGIADILRGSTNPNETLGAQQLKAQWGSLRIQNRQAEVARIARDLFRMKAEIIANKFSWNTITQMTGITAPTAEMKQQAQMQAQMAQQQGQPVPDDVKEFIENPTQEEIEQVLRSDLMRSYRIDVESDSTIRGDLSRNQATMSAFLQGTAQYIQAMAPIVQIAPSAIPAVLEVYSAFSRQFKLGKQAEDALAKLIDDAGEPAQPQQPDPRIEAEKMKSDAEKFRAQADMQSTTMQMQRDKAKHEMDMNALAAKTNAKMIESGIYPPQPIPEPQPLPGQPPYYPV